MSKLINIEILDDLIMSTPEELYSTFVDFEPITKNVIIENINDGDIFLDVGANFGYFSIIASRYVGPNGKVISFEPSSETFTILQHNTSKLKNIEIYKTALGSKQETKHFFHANDYVNSGFTKSPFQNPSEYSGNDLSVTTLDKFIKGKVKKVDFIKCDVQGDDIDVLIGAKDTIQSNNNLKLIVEWAPTWMKSAGYDLNDLPKILKELGFKDIIVVDDWHKNFKTVDQFIDEFNNDKSGKRFCNLFCKK